MSFPTQAIAIGSAAEAIARNATRIKPPGEDRQASAKVSRLCARLPSTRDQSGGNGALEVVVGRAAKRPNGRLSPQNVNPGAECAGSILSWSRMGGGIHGVPELPLRATSD